MKVTGIGFLVLTTLVLLFLTIFASLGFSFSLLFYMMSFGQLLLLFTVYKILTDNYKTSKRFSDWYEDHSPEEKD